MQKLIIMAVVAALAPVAALAEGSVTGAELGFNYSSFAEADARDTNKATLSGSLEYAFTNTFAMQADVAQNFYGLSNWNGSVVTLHTLAHLGESFALGGYFGHEWIDGNHVEHYGLEAKQTFGVISVEGELGKIVDGNSDATSMGLSGSYALTDQLSLGGGLRNVDDSGDDYSRVDATAAYTMASGLQLNGGLGIVDKEGDDAETTFGFGVKKTFGGSDGTTFGSRGLQSLLPGL